MMGIMTDTTYNVRIDPGGHQIRVRADENVLGAALAAGIRLPHSCRAGRCASCKSKLVAGKVEYPAGAPPGITPDEIARGEVLLCQARPLSDLVVASRRIALDAPEIATAEVIAIEPLPLGALRVQLRISGRLTARPGQFVNASNHGGDLERLAVIANRPGELDLEAIDDGSALRLWLAEEAVPGSGLRLSGPFDRPR
jgi:CDP-4-dehydro-6-deoxyglucose reductase, E3